MAKKFSSRAEAGKRSGVVRKERDRRKGIAHEVATGALCIPVIVVCEDDDARRDVLHRAAFYLKEDGARTCVLHLDSCSEAEAFAQLAIESTETTLGDDAPRAVVCDGLPLEDESYARAVAYLVEHGAARGTRIVLGIAPEHAGIVDAIRGNVSYEVEPPARRRLRSPLPTYLYVSEAAEIARTSEKFIYRLVHDGEFTDVKRRGRRIMLRTSTFLDYIGVDEDDFR